MTLLLALTNRSKHVKFGLITRVRLKKRLKNQKPVLLLPIMCSPSETLMLTMETL